MSGAAEFGARLRAARERRGVALEAVAAESKISASHFAAMERGDLSRWPTGIFARGFVHAYAQAVGLDPAATVAEFVRITGEADRKGRPAGANVPAVAPPPVTATPALRAVPRNETALRLWLAEDPSAAPDGVQAATAGARAGWLVLGEATVLTAVVAGTWWWTGGGLPLLAAGLLAIAYYGASLGAWGRSPLQQYLSRRLISVVEVSTQPARVRHRRRVDGIRATGGRTGRQRGRVHTSM